MILKDNIVLEYDTLYKDESVQVSDLIFDFLDIGEFFQDTSHRTSQCAPQVADRGLPLDVFVGK